MPNEFLKGDLKVKSTRHSYILEIISEKEIETQEELMNELRRRGLDVTQATVSRDIKQLGLIKTVTEHGNYKYSAPRREKTGSNSKFRNILKETIISVVNAENIVVIKTYSGMANAAAAAVDAMAEESIVGSLAGDDTIFIVAKTTQDAAYFADILKEVIKLA